MPELPEAETIATQLNHCLSGVSFGRVILRRREMVHGDRRSLTSTLPGRRVRQVTRRGKRVLIELHPKAMLVFRLGMTGQIMVTPATKLRDRHVHLSIKLQDDDRELRFRDVRRFGGIWFREADSQADDDGLGGLGPEPLELDLAQFAEICNRARQIKALLLDQSAIAGLGNIYCDEALFQAKVHPLIPASELKASQRRRLFRSIQAVLTRAIKAGGSTLRDYRTATGQEGNFQNEHRVYGRTGEPCGRCKAVIERQIIAGRSTHFCPLCQAVPGVV